MKKLKLTFISNYRSKGGNVVFVYTISGSTEAKELYREINGDNVRYQDDDENKPMLYFSTVYLGKTNELFKPERSERFIVDNFNQDVLVSQAGNLLRQTQNNPLLANAIAQVAAQQLLGISNNSNVNTAVNTPVSTPENTTVVPPVIPDIEPEMSLDNLGNTGEQSQTQE